LVELIETMFMGAELHPSRSSQNMHRIDTDLLGLYR